MIKSNFSFLSSQWPNLTRLGLSAEQYAYSDPQSSIIKLRCLAESIVNNIYQALSLEVEPQSTFIQLLNSPNFKELVGKDICSKFHALRMEGNAAAHDNYQQTSHTALRLVREAYLIARWFTQTIQADYVEIPEYVEPENAQNSSLLKDNAVLKNKVSIKEAILEEAAAELRELKEELALTKQMHFNAEELAAKQLVFKNAGMEAASSFDLRMSETHKHFEIEDFFTDSVLTNGQQEAVSRIDAFLGTDKLDSFLLHGYAGTGKTFITKGVVEYLTAIGRNFVLMAPTGKAAKVISNKTSCDASTIHRKIYDFKDINDQRENEQFPPIAKLKVNNDSGETVYIVDESSMISDRFSQSDSIQFGSGYLLRDLLEYAGCSSVDQSRKIIFIGDNAQLPPVGMNFSPALIATYLQDKQNLKLVEWTLDEVVRQKSDSGVMDNATMLRNSISKDEFNQLDFKINKADVEPISADEVISKYMQLCEGQIAKTKDLILIASSNSQVSNYNQQCRSHFFPNQLELCARDKVISVSNHYCNELDEPSRVTVMNGEFGMINKVLSASEVRAVVFTKKLENGKTENVQVSLTFRDVELMFRNDAGVPTAFTAKILENLLYNDEASITPDESKALYVDFINRHPDLRSKRNEFQRNRLLKTDPYFNAFKLKFGYALTCHKAQGSEWKHVMVKCSSQHLNTLTKDYFRWLYTAITRTSERLYVIDKPEIKLGGGLKRVGGQDNCIVQEQQLPSNTRPTLEANATSAISTEEPIIDNNENTFGIPESQGHLLSLLRTVKALILESEVEVSNIQHYQYQEAYLLQRNQDFVEVRFGYNGKFKVSSVIVNGSSELDNQIRQILSPIQGAIFIANDNALDQKQFRFTESFLELFHQRLVETCEPIGISISNLEEKPYMQRYSFLKDGNSAVIDIYYNGKKHLTKFNSQKNLSNSVDFLQEVEKVLEEAL